MKYHAQAVRNSSCNPFSCIN